MVVYNISESATQQPVEEATWAITGNGRIGLIIQWADFAVSFFFLVLFSVFDHSPQCRDGELQVSKNVHLSLKCDDLGHDQGTESGELVGRHFQTCPMNTSQTFKL